MTAVPKRKLTEAEYLTIERAAPFKSEFYNGEMFAMAGASRPHNAINDNLVAEILTRLKGSGCRTYSRDMRVKVSRAGLYTYPDLLIVCGPEEYAAEDADTLLNPKVIVEVLSDSTEAYDRGAKFRMYKKLPSLQEYVLVAQDEPAVDVFVRKPEGGWHHDTFAGLDAELPLATVPVRVPLAEVYRGVEFPPPPDRPARDRRPGSTCAACATFRPIPTPDPAVESPKPLPGRPPGGR